MSERAGTTERADGRLPGWFEPLLTRVRDARAVDFTRIPTPDEGGRPAAVLILLAEGEQGPDVLIMQRAATLRTHAGQPAFPGGAVEPQDADLTETALREANEEVGLDRSSVTVLAQLPTLWIPVTDFLVTPVLAWWHAPHPVGAHDPREVAHVARLPLAELADPAHRLRVRHSSGWIGPAFHSRGMLVWGFTAGVLSTLLELGGWARPWNTDRIEALPTPPATLSGTSDVPSVG
ncbi:NUDIX hydrolase [Catellatospora bangladeshensis]|uniref:Coenzyme A pyrophosphatase n=1 Tax=Catellatospora bangladeshensis TaxID=310355 RepID=A0A8J3JBS4_9ACTN|nr:CoA pyrophosphatase [Catellatospora bangladeshensis]GIF81351.1 coenzyme A pyrophosphatase [Catellatospora bangladeshensis]